MLLKAGLAANVKKKKSSSLRGHTKMAGYVSRMEDRRASKILTGKPTGKRPLGIPRREDNIGIYLKEIGVNTKSWIDSA